MYIKNELLKKRKIIHFFFTWDIFFCLFKFLLVFGRFHQWGGGGGGGLVSVSVPDHELYKLQNQATWLQCN